MVSMKIGKILISKERRQTNWVLNEPMLGHVTCIHTHSLPQPFRLDFGFIKAPSRTKADFMPQLFPMIQTPIAKSDRTNCADDTLYENSTAPRRSLLSSKGNNSAHGSNPNVIHLALSLPSHRSLPSHALHNRRKIYMFLLLPSNRPFPFSPFLS